MRWTPLPRWAPELSRPLPAGLFVSGLGPPGRGNALDRWGAPPGEAFRRGYWLRPTVYGDVTMNMQVAREEIFGPILSILKWATEAEALAMANATEYGLAAGVWTQDLKTAMTFARGLQSGFVWINTTARHFVGTPFGGWKNSGLGREECLEELLSYTHNKAIHIFV